MQADLFGGLPLLKKPQQAINVTVPETDWTFPEGEQAYPSLEGHGAIAIDVETYDPDLREKGPGVFRDGYICGVAVATAKGFKQYYPLRHDGNQNCHLKGTLDWLQAQLKLPVPKIGANLQYDIEFLMKDGLTIEGPFYDVQIAEALLNENRASFSLDAIAMDYLGEGKVKSVMERWIEQVYGPRNIMGQLWRTPPQLVGPYAEGDVDLPLRIFQKQKEKLEASSLWDLFLMEARLIPLLIAMRQRGVRVNVDQAHQVKKEMGQERDNIVAKVRQKTGANVDMWAPATIAPAYDALGVKYPLTPKTQQPSITKPWLEAQEDWLSKEILRARSLDKTMGTFIQGYILDGNIDGRIHGQFHQAKGEGGGTVTGRFSSSHPNLQNIPSRGPMGKLVRSIFRPEDGQVWWARDWSQIEYRLMVHFAEMQEKQNPMLFRGAAAIVDGFIENPATDFHQYVADLTGLQRTPAKSVNFGIIYGLGRDGLADSLGGDHEKAEQVLATYHERMPFVKPLMDKAMRVAAREGRVMTILGRRRRFWMWEKRGQLLFEGGNKVVSETSPEPGAKRAFTHAALNAKIQGSAADIMKKAMVEILDSGALEVIGAPHLTVHDELDGSYDSTSKEHQEALQTVHHIMENCMADKIRIPLKADGSEGQNWAEAK